MAKGKKGTELARQRETVQNLYYDEFLQPKQRAATRTQLIGRMLERRLYDLSMSRFEWKGLPPEINKRWMEMALIDSGLSVFFYDNRLGRYLAMRGTGTGNLNMIGDPTEFMVWGNGLYGTRRLDASDVVPIWANRTRTSDLDIIRIYAARLAEMDRTIEINSKNARQNKILQVPQNSRLSAANINQQLEAGSNAIETVDQFDMSSMVQVLDLGIHPDNILNLSILRGRIWAECMMMLGINSGNTDKKERLVAAEVSSNDDMVGMIREEYLIERKEACSQINDKYGLNVTVDYHTEHGTGALAAGRDGVIAPKANGGK